MRSTHLISTDQTAGVSVCMSSLIHSILLNSMFKLAFERLERLNPKILQLEMVGLVPTWKFALHFLLCPCHSKMHHPTLLLFLCVSEKSPVLVLQCTHLAWIRWKIRAEITAFITKHNVHLYQEWQRWRRQTWSWQNHLCNCLLTYNNLLFSSKLLSGLGFLGWWRNLDQNAVLSSSCLDFQHL